MMTHERASGRKKEAKVLVTGVESSSTLKRQGTAYVKKPPAIDDEKETRITALTAGVPGLRTRGVGKPF